MCRWSDHLDSSGNNLTWVSTLSKNSHESDVPLVLWTFGRSRMEVHIQKVSMTFLDITSFNGKSHLEGQDYDMARLSASSISTRHNW